MEDIDNEAIAEAVEACLSGETGSLKDSGFGVTSLADLGEVYLRAPDGQIFKMVVEPVDAADAEGWGITFED